MNATRPRTRGRPPTTARLMEELEWQLDCHEGRGAILTTLGLGTEKSLKNACQRAQRMDLWHRFNGNQNRQEDSDGHR